jgi:hypothetical protein
LWLIYSGRLTFSRIHEVVVVVVVVVVVAAAAAVVAIGKVQKLTFFVPAHINW